MRVRRAAHLAPVLCALLAAGCAARPLPSAEPAPSSTARADSAPTLRIRNNHELAYAGPIRAATTLPDGLYRGEGATAEVRAGIARAVVDLGPKAAVELRRTGAADASPFVDGPLTVASGSSRLDLRWLEDRVGSLELGLVVVPGTRAGPDAAVGRFEPLPLEWRPRPDGTLAAVASRDGFRLALSATPYAGGWVDLRASLVRQSADTTRAYVALVRRLTTPGVHDVALRFNGRTLEVDESPETWERDFWYTRGVDWTSWRAGALALAAVNGFTPAPTVRRGPRWVEGSHFYVWERTRRIGDALYLLSEISGPNPDQAKSRYMPVTPHAPILAGDTVQLKWRLAITPDPTPGWEDGQLRVHAGYRATRPTAEGETTELGVPAVEFGTAYFPYSTFAENFDYYRVPGLNKETWWPFSARQWSEWRAYLPRMRTDLHIVRSMGFDWVRLHHLELLREMERPEALAFLDSLVAISRSLDLRVLVDSEGPAEWLALIAARYPDDITRFEIENEIVIQGIGPGDAERWTELYGAVKAASPGAQAFLTGAGNNGMFERLRSLGVPFDRVGLHAYKHGPEWKDAFASHALGTGGYASDIGKPATLGEFNWKSLTRLSPEARRAEYAEIFETMLRPRAIPEFFQFHLQETIGVNPSIGRSGIRHYEVLSLDRRPKPEALELMRLVRQYTRGDAPVRDVPVEIGEVRFADGAAHAAFAIANRSGRALSVRLDARAFDGIEARVDGPARVELAPGEVHEGRVSLRLAPGSGAGTYHHFLRAAYDGGTAWGWGVAANEGAPTFDARPVLDGRVRYPQGADVVRRVDWSRPLAVAFGADAPVLEMEMAYLVGNTLQAATGRPVRISSAADLPDSLLRGGTVVLVGTRASNALVAAERSVARPAANEGGDARGVIELVDRGTDGQRLLLTGENEKAVQAAATDVVLRYWKHAKDAAIRISGMEAGAALGHPAGITETDLP